VREKYYWLAGGWKLVLEWYERKTLLGCSLLELPNRVKVSHRLFFFSFEIVTHFIVHLVIS
jgi:hypothetical protein